MNNGLVKVITGIRRCGKSYLMNNIFYDYLLGQGIDRSHIIKFAFDSADDLELIGEDFIELEKNGQKVDPGKFMAYIRSRITDPGKYYLLLDEIQNLGSFESVLNGYLRKDGLDLYVTGSNSKFLSSDILTEFEGRGDEIHVLPLSFSEFYAAFGGTREEAYEEYSVFGGLPLLLSMKTDEQKSKHLISQAEKVYIRDVIKRNGLRDTSDIRELLDVLASGIASFTNPTKLEATFKSVKRSNISRATIEKYIDCFIDAFLVSKAKKYDVRGRRDIQTPFKRYFEDSGIRNARLGFRQVEPTHIMDNIVYNELRYRGYEVDVGIVESRERENGKDVKKFYEIDFIATLGSKKYYIQSAYDIPTEEKRKQETRSFDRTDDSFGKILVVRDPVVPRYDDKGYLMIGLLDFLANDKSTVL
jgi:predicted AAA+ superfamily ATPase